MIQFHTYVSDGLVKNHQPTFFNSPRFFLRQDFKEDMVQVRPGFSEVLGWAGCMKKMLNFIWVFPKIGKHPKMDGL